MEIELPSISTGLSDLPEVVNWAIPSGIIAYTLVDAENFSLLFVLLVSLFATVVAELESLEVGTLTK